MHYWNRTNFDGLKTIGEAYLAREGYEGFANYCILRGKGLKKSAFAALNQFLGEAKSLEIEKQRGFAAELAALSFNNKDVHQLLPQPLKSYITAILQSWCDEGPGLAAPYRWLAVIAQDSKYFELALHKDAEDQIALGGLASDLLRVVDYQMHHLSESIFIGCEMAASDALVRAAEYTMRLAHSKWKHALIHE